MNVIKRFWKKKQLWHFRLDLFFFSSMLIAGILTYLAASDFVLLEPETYHDNFVEGWVRDGTKKKALRNCSKNDAFVEIQNMTYLCAYRSADCGWLAKTEVSRQMWRAIRILLGAAFEPPSHKTWNGKVFFKRQQNIRLEQLFSIQRH